LVVRAFNEERHIERLLEGVRHQTVRDVEVILVDSGSTDATAAIAAQYRAKVVHIPPAEFTFGRSLNRGLPRPTTWSSSPARTSTRSTRTGWSACSNLSKTRKWP
jgi:cellulose synthase/poly-beta-1,6-N-acetylglucosamine synthase-like glycosyltransferase